MPEVTMEEKSLCVVILNITNTRFAIRRVLIKLRLIRAQPVTLVHRRFTKQMQLPAKYFVRRAVRHNMLF